jgi:hypothetical protein
MNSMVFTSGQQKDASSLHKQSHTESIIASTFLMTLSLVISLSSVKAGRGMTSFDRFPNTFFIENVHQVSNVFCKASSSEHGTKAF